MSDEFLSHADAAVINRNLVLRYIRSHKLVSRTDIWSDMRMSRASVTQIVRQLCDSSLILETTGDNHEPCSKVKGRQPMRNLMLNENSRHMYIFDWLSSLLCLVNLGGNIVGQTHLDFPTNCMPNNYAEILLEGIASLKRKYPLDEKMSLGLGMCMPGLIDSRNGIVLNSVELNWRNVNLKALFSTEFGEDVFLERISNMIALGEYEYGVAKGQSHILMVLMSNEGIGASVVIHGDCQHGCNYMHGELGHIKLPSDILCSCGQHGCLEAVVRYQLLNNGGCMDDTIMEYLSTAISTAVTLYDPGIVLLSGNLLQKLTRSQQEAFVKSILARITDSAMRNIRFHICLEDADMAIRGMCAHIINHQFYV